MTGAKDDTGTLQFPEPGDIDIEVGEMYPQTWKSLYRHWENVLENDEVLASRSGGWLVRLESTEGNAPPEDPDEIVIYDTAGTMKYNEVGRWRLDEVTLP